jgi:hypothetical protein
MLVILRSATIDSKFSDLLANELKRKGIELATQGNISHGDLEIYLAQGDTVTFIAQTLAARIYRSELRKRYEVDWGKKLLGKKCHQEIAASTSAILTLPSTLSDDEKYQLANSLAEAIAEVNNTVIN